MDDMQAKFRQAEAQYNELKEKRSNGEITAEQMKADLKRLMLQDQDGKYWMLGGKSGNWYVHDGAQWQEADPFEQFKQQEQEQEEDDDDVLALEMSDAVHESADAEKQFIYLDKDDQMSSAASSAVDSGQQQDAAADDSDYYVLNQPAAAAQTAQESENDYEIAGVSGNDEFFGGGETAAPDTESQSENDYEIAGVSGNDELFGGGETAAPDTESQSENDYEIAGVSGSDELFGDSDALESQSTYDIADASESEHAYNIADASESTDGYEMVGSSESDDSFGINQAAETALPADEDSAATQAVETAEVQTSEPVVTISDEREQDHFAAEGVVTPDYIACETCNSRIPPYAAYCMFCGASRNVPGEEAVVSPASQEMGSELLVKSIKIASF